jgi:hypothetical protein
LRCLLFETCGEKTGVFVAADRLTVRRPIREKLRFLRVLLFLVSSDACTLRRGGQTQREVIGAAIEVHPQKGSGISRMILPGANQTEGNEDNEVSFQSNFNVHGG